jgi:hypothetical protein
LTTNIRRTRRQHNSRANLAEAGRKPATGRHKRVGPARRLPPAVPGKACPTVGVLTCARSAPDTSVPVLDADASNMVSVQISLRPDRGRSDHQRIDDRRAHPTLIAKRAPRDRLAAANLSDARRIRPRAWGNRPRPATLPSVPSDERLSQTVDQFSGSGHQHTTPTSTTHRRRPTLGSQLDHVKLHRSSQWLPRGLSKSRCMARSRRRRRLGPAAAAAERLVLVKMQVESRRLP